MDARKPNVGACESCTWMRQALEENAALDIAREENERLRRLVRTICDEDGYSCADCANDICPFNRRNNK